MTLLLGYGNIYQISNAAIYEVKMTVLADFNENGDFLGLKSKALTPEDVNLYIAQYSHQRCLGYIDCLNDIVEILDHRGTFTLENPLEGSEKDWLTNLIKDRNDVWMAFEQKLGQDLMHFGPKINL